jgi:Immune inhibitor A-like, MAM domain/FlgD Ig-like domain
VGGFIGGVESPRAAALAYTGILDCTFADSLETGATAFQLQSPWARTSTLAADGTWSLTDSPGGNYGDNVDVSASIIVPVELTAWPTLEFDQICITEATYDFGIVEVSSDFGATWTELARYDMDDYPQWNDGTADPGDWVHTVLDLNPWVGKKVRVRFRLLTDGYVNEDGWYLDNITISNPTCRSVTGVPPTPAGPVPILTLAGPNPFRGRLALSLAAKTGDPARIQVFDAAGRLVRTLFDGPAPAARIEAAWDGKDGTGRPTAAGLYFLRGISGKATAVKRVVKLP